MGCLINVWAIVLAYPNKLTPTIKASFSFLPEHPRNESCSTGKCMYMGSFWQVTVVLGVLTTGPLTPPNYAITMSMSNVQVSTGYYSTTVAQRSRTVTPAAASWNQLQRFIAGLTLSRCTSLRDASCRAVGAVAGFKLFLHSSTIHCCCVVAFGMTDSTGRPCCGQNMCAIMWSQPARHATPIHR